VRHTFSAALAVTWFRLLNISRYPGQLALEIFIPSILVAIPVLVGQATAGASGPANFRANTGTDNYVGYLLIGSNMFIIITGAFWHIAYWLRFEQETGTLESIYLTPTDSLTVASGVALYSMARGLLSTGLAYVVGCVIFRINPLQGNLLLALAFLLVGLIPMYGLAFLFGALVFEVKEANALVGLVQWVISLLMGIFFPVTVLPPLIRALAMILPPIWAVNGVRSALLGLDFFLGQWYRDLAMLWAFLLITPLFSAWVFHRVEQSVHRNRGMGEF
jgi:ABC-2 type transport system permease protein